MIVMADALVQPRCTHSKRTGCCVQHSRQ
jgi:hypothetical protein